MTTIVYDSHTLATDTLGIDPNDNKISTQKIHMTKFCGQEHIFVGAGAIATIDMIKDYILEQTFAHPRRLYPWPVKIKGAEDRHARVYVSWNIKGKYHWLSYDSQGIDIEVIPFDRQFAWGSGMDFAIGALSMDADAIESIRVASIYDEGTGGDIHYWRSGFRTFRACPGVE